MDNTKPRKRRAPTAAARANIGAGIKAAWNKRRAAADAKLIDEVITNERCWRKSWTN